MHSHAHGKDGCTGCCGGTGPKNPTTQAEVNMVREAWLMQAMREIEDAEAAEEEAHAQRPSLESLPAAEDLMEVVVANVCDWNTLMQLRTASHWLRGIVTRHAATVGIRSGPRIHDFDERGVLHLLGSAFGRLPTWSLEETLSRVRVFTSEGTCSSPVDDESAWRPFFRRDVRRPGSVGFNNPVAYLVDRTPRRVFLHQGIGGYMALDLGPFVRVAPEAFTLRHSSQQDRALRSFRFEGCRSLPPSLVAAGRGSSAGSTSALDALAADDEGWETLLTVVDDGRLGTAEHSSASWEVSALATDDGELSLERATGYRCFRIVKTGPDASGAQYLHLSGIELYGQVRLSLEGVDGRAQQGEYTVRGAAERELYNMYGNQPHLLSDTSSIDQVFETMAMSTPPMELQDSASDSDREPSSTEDPLE